MDCRLPTDAHLGVLRSVLVTLSFPSLDRPVVPHRPRVFGLHPLGTGQSVREILLQVKGGAQTAGNGLTNRDTALCRRREGKDHRARVQRNGQIRDHVALSCIRDWERLSEEALPSFSVCKGEGRRTVFPDLKGSAQCSLTTKWN